MNYLVNTTLRVCFIIVVNFIQTTFLFAQSSISGTIQSIPSMTIPDSARITLTATNFEGKHSQITVNGKYYIKDLKPGAVYKREIRVKNHYLFEDYIDVGWENIEYNVKIIECREMNSQVYLNDNKSFLYFLKNLTGTYVDSINSRLYLEINSPLKLDARNYNISDSLSMPEGIRPYLDTVLLDYSIKTNNTVTFSESMEGDVRVALQFPFYNEMPSPSFEWTIYDYDLSHCYFARDTLITKPDNEKYGVFSRALLKALHFRTSSIDPSMVSYITFGGTERLHPDEAEVLKVVSFLKYYTDMRVYKDIKVNTIPNAAPLPFEFTTPTNGSTSLITNGNLEIKTSPTTKRDSDGDLQVKIIHLQGLDLDTLIHVTGDIQTVTINSSRLKPNQSYLITGAITDSMFTVNALNCITFSTPDLVSSNSPLVYGTIMSIPSKTIPDSTRITFTNIETQEKYSNLAINGKFFIRDIPNGLYQRKVMTKEHYLNLDTIQITGINMTEERVLKNREMVSQLYLSRGFSFLWFLKLLTYTWDGSISGQRLNLPKPHLRLFARNYDPNDSISMPVGERHHIDSALLSFERETEGIVSFREEPTDSAGGIVFKFLPSAQMPSGAYGYCDIVDWQNTYINCLFDRALMVYPTYEERNNFIVMHELGHALNMSMLTDDPWMVFSHYSNGSAKRIHPDEAEVLKVIFTLGNGTDMSKYRDSVITHLQNAAPTPFQFISPSNGSTAVYTNGNLEIKTSATTMRDADGDLQYKNIHLQGLGLDTLITTAGNIETITIKSSRLKGKETYTIAGSITDSIVTVNASNSITFYSPNTAPTTPILISPTISDLLDPNNTIEFKWHESIDLDGDNLTYILRIWNAEKDTSIYTTDTLTILPANKLQGHRTYNCTVKASDGELETLSDSTLFSTVNSAPSKPTLITPSNTDVINTNKTVVFKWHKSIDPDGDNVSYMLRIWTTDKDTTISANDTISVLPANKLKSGKTYSYTVKSTDGLLETTSDTQTFNTTITGIGDNSFTDMIKIYPNPVKDDITIELILTTPQKVNISIYNIIGEQVYKTKMDVGITQMHLDLHELKHGIYLLKVESGGSEIKTFKFTKE